MFQDQESILNQLENPAVRLKNINPDYVNFYFETLLDAKERKEQVALNRVILLFLSNKHYIYGNLFSCITINSLYFLQSLNDSYVPDAYDELLTQAEIQGHINNVNSK